MEHEPFEDVFPIKKLGIFQPAMLLYQRVHGIMFRFHPKLVGKSRETNLKITGPESENHRSNLKIEILNVWFNFSCKT